MDKSRVGVFAESIAHLISRRGTLRAIGMASIGSTLAVLIARDDDLEARKKKRKKHKKCKPPKGKCGKKCKPLNTNENCGRCGNRCEGAETCQDGICCAQPLCRGECRDECPPPTANFEFPQQLDYGAGTIKPNNFSQAELNNHVRTAYDRWKDRYLVDESRDADGNQVFRIALGKPGTPNHGVTVSEGQGFGMVIVATMAGYDDEAQEIFDGLWRFRLAHPSEIDSRLMDWRVPGGEGNDSAFDGDADIAYGLLLADAQWGNDGLTDLFDYQAAALEVIAGIKDSTIGPTSNLPMLGDWVESNGSKYNQNTPRTSDFMPGHFRAFGRATGDPVWDDVVEACQDVITELQQEFSQNAAGSPPLTGLLPDFAVMGSGGFRPAPPRFLEGDHDGDYNYNAGRDPWRIGTDALLNEEGTSAAQAALIANWANASTNGNAHAIKAGYKLNGAPLADYFTTFFAAPIGVAAMTDPDLQDWLDAVYDAVHDVQEDYYEDTVTLFCMLVMTGNFWDPTRV